MDTRTPPIRFGSFEFDPLRRRLGRNGIVVRLGQRPLDLLAALAAHPGEVMSPHTLIDTVWPGQGIDLGSFRVHISALRKALGGDASGQNYIINEHGRGYRFVGEAHVDPSPAPVTPAPRPPSGVPRTVGRVIGRDAAIEAVLASLETHRLVTIAGPGGIGKSTLALAIANRLAPASCVHLIELSALTSGDAVALHIAAGLGLSDAGGGSPSDLAQALASDAMLLVLDNCEHVIETVAELCEALLVHAAGVRILTTSREALRVSGEKIHRLTGMDIPAPGGSMTIGDALRYSAVELLVERAAAMRRDVPFTDEEVPDLIELCRKLDGIPLALELVAGWVGVLSLSEIALGLDGRMMEIVSGRRTIAPRQRTLLATLNWSYDLLAPMERKLLLRLAAFRSGFILQGAQAAATCASLPGKDLPHYLASLVAKSLVNVEHRGSETRYRLLETTRVYAWQRLTETGDLVHVQRRHAMYLAAQLAPMEADQLTMRRSTWIERYGAIAADVRAALRWALSSEGDATIALEIVGAAIPMGLQYWPPAEFAAILETALSLSQRTEPHDDTRAIRLAYQVGHILNQIDGDTTKLQSLVATSSSGQRESGNQLVEELMSAWVASFTQGRYLETLESAKQIAAFAERDERPELLLLGSRVMAQSLHFLGEHTRASELARRVLAAPYEHLPHSQISHKISMRIVLARSEALCGRQAEADAIAEDCVALGLAANGVSAAQALALAALPLSLWSHRWDRAAAEADQLRAISEKNGLPYWTKWADQSSRLIDEVRTGQGIGKTWLSTQDAGPKFVDLAATVDPRFLSDVVEDRVQAGHVGWCAPEVLRGQALQLAQTDSSAAESLLKHARALAHKQGATLWAVRIEATMGELAA